MKKLILSFTLLLAVLIANAQRHNLPIDEVAAKWQQKTISNVQDGSFATLLRRFDETWPTWSIKNVRDVIAKGLSKAVLDKETGYTVINDAKNGYVETYDLGTDGEYMSACIWRRNNGHKLLAINLGQPTDPEIEFVCFYDYNPQTKTLTPEPNVLGKWNRIEPSEKLSYKLPHVGKELLITEGNIDANYTHHFEWDGMRPVHKFVEQITILSENYDKKWTPMLRTVSQDGEVTALDVVYSTNDGTAETIRVSLPWPVYADNFHGGEVTMQDINFDGTDDMQIELGLLSSTGTNVFYAGLLWNEAKQKFTECEEFCQIVNASPDPEHRCINGYVVEGMKTTVQRWEWKNGKLELTEQHEENTYD